jgi:hypothetical protein
MKCLKYEKVQFYLDCIHTHTRLVLFCDHITTTINMTITWLGPENDHSWLILFANLACLVIFFLKGNSTVSRTFMQTFLRYHFIYQPFDLMWQFIKMLEEHPKLRISKASVTHEGNNLYMQSPEVLEQMTRPNLSLPMFELLKEVPYATVHATGMAENNGKKVSSLRKLRVAFKGVGASKMDTAESS